VGEDPGAGGVLGREPHGPDSVIAGDTIAALPAALARR